MLGWREGAFSLRGENEVNEVDGCGQVFYCSVFSLALV